MKTICRCLALLTALCLLLFACCACGKEKDAGAAQGTYLSTDGEVPSVYQVPGGVFKYFYKIFLNTYADELQGTYGFDTARSAKEQSYNGETYYELIKRQVKEQLSRVWLLYADAREQGMTLTEAEQALLEQQVKNRASLQDRDITEEDIRQALQITFLAQKYERGEYAKKAFDDAAVYTRLEENPIPYQYYGCYCISLFYGASPDAANPNGLTVQRVKELTAQLLAAATQEEFERIASVYIREYQPSLNETGVANQLANFYQDQVCYTDDSVGAWAFAGEREAGDTYCVDDEANACKHVFFLTALPHLDESYTANIRQVLFAAEQGDRTEAEFDALLQEQEQKARDMLLEFEKEPTEKHFAALAAQTGEADSGELLTDVSAGQLPQALDAWCLDPARRAGDVAVIQSEYGWHAVYYVSRGEQMWRLSVLNDLTAEKIENRLQALKSRYSVAYNDELYDAMSGL